MKKVILIGMVAMVAGIAAADLSINWANTANPVYDVGGSGAEGPFVSTGARVDLMWSVAGAVTVAGAYDLDAALNITEWALDDTVAINNGFGFFGPGGGIFTDADVGGNNVNSGFFFTRIFQDSGDFFLDIELGAGADFIYNPSDSATTFSDNAVGGAPVFIDSNATTVIPEPATFGLMGLAGLGMFLARRKTQR